MKEYALLVGFVCALVLILAGVGTAHAASSYAGQCFETDQQALESYAQSISTLNASGVPMTYNAFAISTPSTATDGALVSYMSYPIGSTTGVNSFYRFAPCVGNTHATITDIAIAAGLILSLGLGLIAGFLV